LISTGDWEREKGFVYGTRVVKALLAAVLMLGVAACSSGPDRDAARQLTMEAYQVYWGNDWNKVIELATEAIEADPDYAWPYSVRGAAYNATGKYDLALADLSRADDLRPNHVAVLTNRAITYMKTKQYDKAEEDLDQVLLLQPNNVIGLVRMAELQSLKENLEDACTYLNEAVDLGFKDIALIEKSDTFENLFYSDCFIPILERMGVE
jgi:tetratricopeptide (TPR) repeat protein